MRHPSLNRPSRDPHYFYVTCCRVSKKNTVHEDLDFLKISIGSISPKIIQKTENDSVERHRFV